MAYDMIVAGASRSARRWDHFATELPQLQDMDRDWNKLGKSASMLAVCAGLILNAAIALPFTVGTRFYSQPAAQRSRNTLAFKGFLVSDAVAFISSAMATCCCTYAGFAEVQNLRVSCLYCGAGCLMAASLAIITAFTLGVYTAYFTGGFFIFPIYSMVLVLCGILLSIVGPLKRAHKHNCALIARLGFRAVIRSLLGDNRRMFCLFISWHRQTILLQIVLFAYCVIVAITIFQQKI